MFKAVQRSVYHEINLDDLSSNVDILRAQCKNPNAGIIGVVKAGAYGHGSVHIAKHLKQIGVERLAVATVEEGIHLRNNGITGPIHVFGNLQSYEVEPCLENHLIPTVGTKEAIDNLVDGINNFEFKMNDSGDSSLSSAIVNIKVDSGMSRYGCQKDELRDLVQLCEDNQVKIDAMFTHFADSSSDPLFTQIQLDAFMDTVEPFSSKNIKLHVSNSAAIVKSVGTDLDFVRPGMGLYGTPTSPLLPYFQQHGIKPIGCVKATPCQVKLLKPGRKVGYGMTYEVQKKEEWIGTFAAGYADGVYRKLGFNRENISGFVRRNKTGENCPIIGIIAMDSMLVKLPEKTDNEETFSLITNDYDAETSAVGIASKIKSISNDIAIGLRGRHSRVYLKSGSEPVVVKALGPDSY